jgi:DNA helicase HerA-like ATPase
VSNDNLFDSTLEVLLNQQGENSVGVVGSPSSTSEIVLDILKERGATKLLGQLVYLLMPQDDKQLAVIGQISQIVTKNRWHEESSLRGIITHVGAVPDISKSTDYRTARVSVQACFSVAPDESGGVSESLLGISPSTSLPVLRVRNEVLDVLLRKYESEIIHLGNVFGTDVLMPFWLKHFDRGKGGAGEAYHIGIFGKTGSGKSGLAAYLLIGYAKHPQMGIIFIDPQGQFTSGQDLPFDLDGTLRQMGREVRRYRLVSQIRLAPEVKLFVRILGKTSFFRGLGIGRTENQDYAAQEMASVLARLLKTGAFSLEEPPPDLLTRCLSNLRDDDLALQRIFLSTETRDRLKNTIDLILSDPDQLERLAREAWQPALDLFMKLDSKQNRRTPLNEVVGSVIRSDDRRRPIILLDISARATSFEGKDELVALFLNQISRSLLWQGEEAFQKGGRLNCLVAIDEAHRYAGYRPVSDSSELADLTRSFVDAVRTTRKFGLGYIFITQTLASLHPEIVQQLRLNAFGYGLTMGSELAKIEDIVGDPQAISLYRAFVDPQSSGKYPFMFTGPASPLSFTGAPLFAQIFTSYVEFEMANQWIDNARRIAERSFYPRTAKVDL